MFIDLLPQLKMRSSFILSIPATILFQSDSGKSHFLMEMVVLMAYKKTGQQPVLISVPTMQDHHYLKHDSTNSVRLSWYVATNTVGAQDILYI